MAWLKKGTAFLPDINKKKLEKLYSLEKNAKAKLRLLAAIQRKEGSSLDDIAYSLKKPKMTIGDWLRRLENDGLNKLYDVKQSGRPPKLSQEQMKKLEKILEESPEKQGIPFLVWTTKLVQYIIAKLFGVDFQLWNVRYIIKKIGFRFKTPRPKNKKANIKAQEEFKKKLKMKYNIILNSDSRSSVLTKHIL